jgi:hypothetical protein
MDITQDHAPITKKSNGNYSPIGSLLKLIVMYFCVKKLIIRVIAP